MIKEIIFAFAGSWVIFSLANFLLLIIGKIMWTNYLCQKCITLWLSLAYFTFNGYSPADAFFIAATASFLAYIYTTKIEE